MGLPDDLGVLYAKHMEHFGCGMAMFQPVAAHDMRPPCVGYIDGNNRWNFIANVEWMREGLQRRVTMDGKDASEAGYILLEREPMKMEQMGIEWRPRVSVGVRQYTVDADGNTPNVGLPVGVDGHITYKSKSSFGAVLMAQKPVTLTSYNDETLFNSWLRANRARLSLLHGHQLRRHGLWLVTRTYTTPRASITAWDAKDKEANMSVKAKASMMGELGGDLEWEDKSTDKDWSHYSGKDDSSTVVVFFDGIEMPSVKWWWENLKVSAKVGDIRRKQLESSLHRQQSNKRQADAALGKDHSQARPHTERPRMERPHSARPPTEEQDLLAEDLWGSYTPLQGPSPADGRSLSRGRQAQSRRAEISDRSISTPTRLSKYLNYEQEPAHPRQHDGDMSPAPNGKATPVAQRFSTASTATSSNPRYPDRRSKDYETSSSNGDQRAVLHRKTASPSLRQAG